MLGLELGLGLFSGSNLVGVCRHLAAVVWSTYNMIHDGRVHDGSVRNINHFCFHLGCLYFCRQYLLHTLR